VIPEYVAYIERTTGFKSTIVTSDALRTGVSGGDLNGFFFYHTRHLRPHRDFFRSLFQPQEDMREWLDEPLRILRERGKTIVAIHMRAGDYKWLPNLGFTLTTPAKWWIEWLDANWSKLDEPVFLSAATNSRQ
jgi:hypothetical protein